MCEPPTDGARGDPNPDPSSTGAAPHNNNPPAHSSSCESTTMAPGQGLGLGFVSESHVAPNSSSSSSSITNTTNAPDLVSPPLPSPNPECRSQESDDRPVEQLAHQLRNQSLRQPSPNWLDHPSTLSPPLEPDEDLMRWLANTEDVAMQTDRDDELWDIAPAPNRRPTPKHSSSENMLAMLNRGSQCTIRPPPRSATPLAPNPDLETSRRSDFDLHLGPIQVDEGYCDEEEDFSWLESVVSLRDASAPGGIAKKYGLRYKTSAEAASRCKNLVHCRPRMRRRGQRSKHRRKTETGESSSALVSCSN